MTAVLMLIDFSQVSMFLSAISSIAVIAGAAFIVFQLRQNGRLIEASTKETKTNISLALLEKLTEESFAKRRKRMYDAIREYGAKDWEGFDDSLDDFEARNFAYIYELIGQLTRDGILDASMVMNSLQYLVVLDWDAFSPLVKHLSQRLKVKVNPWRSFEWLAEETRKYLKERDGATS
ncbi:MAG: hypothetical protein ACLPY5_10205 [Candidatus Bathyarchaeia archaeon]